MTMVQGPTRSRVQGAFVVRGVLLALLATAVLPPAGAWWLNSRRVATTRERVQAAMNTVATSLENQVLCGPGRPPDSTATGAREIHATWLAAVVVDPAGRAPARDADAWGQCLLVGNGWVLSAGANGVIETPPEETTTQGDDIGVRLR